MYVHLPVPTVTNQFRCHSTARKQIIYPEISVEKCGDVAVVFSKRQEGRIALCKPIGLCRFRMQFSEISLTGMRLYRYRRLCGEQGDMRGSGHVKNVRRTVFAVVESLRRRRCERVLLADAFPRMIFTGRETGSDTFRTAVADGRASGDIATNANASRRVADGLPGCSFTEFATGDHFSHFRAVDHQERVRAIRGRRILSQLLSSSWRPESARRVRESSVSARPSR